MKSSVHNGSLLFIMSFYLMPLISNWLVELYLQVGKHFTLPPSPKFSNFRFFCQQNHSAIVPILLPTWKNSETLFWITLDNSFKSPLEPTEDLLHYLLARTFFLQLYLKIVHIAFRFPSLKCIKLKEKTFSTAYCVNPSDTVSTFL